LRGAEFTVGGTLNGHDPRTLKAHFDTLYFMMKADIIYEKSVPYRSVPFFLVVIRAARFEPEKPCRVFATSHNDALENCSLDNRKLVQRPFRLVTTYISVS
jgi:hypothetical protein